MSSVLIYFYFICCKKLKVDILEFLASWRTVKLGKGRVVNSYVSPVCDIEVLERLSECSCE